jgi:hypothetical protein
VSAVAGGLGEGVEEEEGSEELPAESAAAVVQASAEAQAAVMIRIRGLKGIPFVGVNRHALRDEIRLKTTPRRHDRVKAGSSRVIDRTLGRLHWREFATAFLLSARGNME